MHACSNPFSIYPDSFPVRAVKGPGSPPRRRFGSLSGPLTCCAASQMHRCIHVCSTQKASRVWSSGFRVYASMLCAPPHLTHAHPFLPPHAGPPLSFPTPPPPPPTHTATSPSPSRQHQETFGPTPTPTTTWLLPTRHSLARCPSPSHQTTPTCPRTAPTHTDCPLKAQERPCSNSGGLGRVEGQARSTQRLSRPAQDPRTRRKNHSDQSHNKPAWASVVLDSCGAAPAEACQL